MQYGSRKIVMLYVYLLIKLIRKVKAAASIKAIATRKVVSCKLLISTFTL